MFVWLRKIEFYKGKSDCKAIVIAVWGLGESPDVVSEGKHLKSAGFIMPLLGLNGLHWH